MEDFGKTSWSFFSDTTGFGKYHTGGYDRIVLNRVLGVTLEVALEVATVSIYSHLQTLTPPSRWP